MEANMLAGAMPVGALAPLELETDLTGDVLALAFASLAFGILALAFALGVLALAFALLALLELCGRRDPWCNGVCLAGHGRVEGCGSPGRSTAGSLGGRGPGVEGKLRKKLCLIQVRIVVSLRKGFDQGGFPSC